MRFGVRLWCGDRIDSDVEEPTKKRFKSRKAMDERILPNGDVIFQQEVSDIENPVCLIYPEEEIIDLKLWIFIQFSKWFLSGKYCSIEFEQGYGNYVRWSAYWEEMDDEYKKTVLREKLEFWLECYTGEGFEYPKTFESIVMEHIENKIGDYFTEGVNEEWQEDLWESDDFFTFRLEVAEYLINQVREETGEEVLERTKEAARAELEREDAERQYELELSRYHRELVRKFQEEKLPWMLSREYIDRPTWKKRSYSAALEVALDGVDEPTKAAILHVGLYCLCSNSVRLDINKIIQEKLRAVNG
jgi:hypothetical protein